MQVSEFFMPYIYITTNENNLTHEGTLNIDYQGRNESGRLLKAPIYAPFNCKCVYAENSYKSGNSRVFESTSKVITPTGNKKVAFIICHDNKPVSKKGQTFKKGDIIGHTGDYGKVTGDHIHVSACHGAFKGFDNTHKHQQLLNADHQYNLFYVNNVIIEKGFNYPWKKHEEKKDIIYKTLENMYIRVGAGTNYRVKLVKEIPEADRKKLTSMLLNDKAILKKDTKFTVIELVKNNYGTWGKSPIGYICIKGRSGREYSKKC